MLGRFLFAGNVLSVALCVGAVALDPHYVWLLFLVPFNVLGALALWSDRHFW